jgi:hypothetical protein
MQSAAMNHDASYKLLFSHPEMVAELLRGYVKEPWVADLDFASLEKVNASYVSEDLRQREDDVVWRVRLRPRWVCLYLLLEFMNPIPGIHPFGASLRLFKSVPDGFVKAPSSRSWRCAC